MNKTLIIFTLLALAVLTQVVHAQEAENGLITETGEVTPSEARMMAERFIQQVDIISQVKIDTQLFESPAFKSLVDFSQPLPVEKSGRPNPFSPF